jgi:hypothetical protein
LRIPPSFWASAGPAKRGDQPIAVADLDLLLDTGQCFHNATIRLPVSGAACNSSFAAMAIFALTNRSWWLAAERDPITPRRGLDG